MTILFRNIPSNLRVPLFYAEVDPSRANTTQAVQRTLIIGQMTGSGTGTAGVAQISQGVTDAQTIGGPGSVLALMTAAYRLNDSVGEVWYLPLADAGGAATAGGNLTFTVAATANGTLAVYIAGVKYALPVLSTQTVSQLATALAALVNADPNAPVTAATVSGACNFTAKNAGPLGNDIDIRVNYGGALNGEVTPTGLTYTIAAMSGGTTAPSLTTPLVNLGEVSFDFIVCPYTDSTSLDALKTFLNDSSGRWSFAQQVYGHVFAHKSGSLGTLTTFGATRNNQHETVTGLNGSPTPAWIIAAATAGAAAVPLKADPARPLQTTAVLGVLAPPLANRFVLTDRNALLFGGVSTFTVGDDGTVRIERLITTYQKNAFSGPDNSYLKVETMFSLMLILREMRAAVESRYAQVKLASNGTVFAADSGVVSPNTIKADVIAKYRDLEYRGLVQNGDAFAANVRVEQNATNPDRVDVLWPGTLMNQLTVFAMLAQFRQS